MTVKYKKYTIIKKIEIYHRQSNFSCRQQLLQKDALINLNTNRRNIKNSTTRGADMVSTNFTAYVMFGSKHSGAAISMSILKKEKTANISLKYDGHGIFDPVKIART